MFNDNRRHSGESVDRNPIELYDKVRQRRRRRTPRLILNDDEKMVKMMSDADCESDIPTGERRGSFIATILNAANNTNAYKPLVNGDIGSVSERPTSSPDTEVDIELKNLEQTSLLFKGDDSESTETPSPEFDVDTLVPDETSCTIAWQVAIPFLIAGLGMVGAGLMLDMVQHWEVFEKVSEIFILVPALLGLKGNLEMTLASRLSTQANLGRMDTQVEMWRMVIGNLALVQCQATVVGFLASLAAVLMGWIPDGVFDVEHGLLLCASSLVTASIASFVLGIIMVAVVLISRKYNINPDNVATPIAASLGDLTTLSLLAGVSSALYGSIGKHRWLMPSIIVVFLVLLPLWVLISKRHPHTREVLYRGWTPVISAMGISSLGGLILDFTVAVFPGIAVYQPVINGVGGNLVAVQASRISTSLHQSADLGCRPVDRHKLCPSPCSSFCSEDTHARTSRVLMLLVMPGHLIFIYMITYVKAGHTSPSLMFVCAYMFVAVLQLFILLYVSQIMIHWMWTRSIDPDNSAIPYLTALGDLLGSALLAMAFQFLFMMGDGDSDVGD